MLIDSCSPSVKKRVFDALNKGKEYLQIEDYEGFFENSDNLDLNAVEAITEMLISSGVTPQEIVNSYRGDSLMPGLFQNNSLTEITIPANIKRILYNTFYNCTKLEKVNFEGKLTAIGPQAFRNCKSLKEIDFNSAQIYLGEKAFANSGLIKVDLPLNAHVDVNCFEYSKDLREVIIQADARTMTFPHNLFRAFNGCNLDKLTIKTAAFEFIVGHKYRGEIDSKDGVKLMGYLGFEPNDSCIIRVI